MLKWSYLVNNIVEGRGKGGRELPILVMPLGIVLKIPCQRIFVLSDLGVPRTFFVDCLGRLFECLLQNIHRQKTKYQEINVLL